MANADTTTDETVKDGELRAWMETGSEDRRDVIVEAALPPRRVVFQQRSGAKAVPKSIESGSKADRNSLLDELNQHLGAIVKGENTRVLKAAGAIVVRATAAEMQAIAKHPLVKAIRPNRRLK